jgi:hypothetical protein
MMEVVYPYDGFSQDFPVGGSRARHMGEGNRYRRLGDIRNMHI